MGSFLLEAVIVGRDLGVGVIVSVFRRMRDCAGRRTMASGFPDPKMLQNLLDLPAIAGSNKRHISDELLDAPLERPSGNHLPRPAGD